VLLPLLLLLLLGSTAAAPSPLLQVLDPSLLPAEGFGFTGPEADLAMMDAAEGM
jgi:hypothetical protein